MIRLLLTAIIIFVFSASSVSQTRIYQEEEWSTQPTIHKWELSNGNEFPAYFVKKDRFLELVVDAQPKMFDSEHVIIHVNNDAGIEKYNKVYLPLYGNRELVSLKVRSISPDNKVTEFNQSNLKELKNVEGYGNFKIFAIEGLTKGGELEYFYTLKTNPQSFGSEIFQKEVPVLEASLKVIYPNRFRFVAKGYNGAPAAKNAQQDRNRAYLYVRANDMPAMAEEQYSSYRGSLMRADFKLESNGSGKEPMSWNSLCSNILSSVYDGKAQSKLSKLIKDINVKDLSKEEQIRKVEDYLKSNFTLKQSREEDYENTKLILSNHVANERGMVKLYIGIFNELSISNQIVFACPRPLGSIDPDFSNPMNLSDEFFYFGDLKMYLDPSTAYSRLGAAPSNVAGSKGLFINYFIVNGIATYIRHNFDTIEPLNYALNDQGIKAVISFDDKLSTLTVDQENRWQGYRGALYRGIYYYRDQQKDKDNFLKDVALSGVDNYSISSRKIEGEGLNLSNDPKNYFKVKTNYTISSLIEKAGEDYILLVGKVIGRQSELYQETERKTDIDFREISDYNHEITVMIPSGYKCTGLDALKINNKVINNGEVVMSFESNYVLEGNKIIIKVNEVYKTLKLPKSKYEDFRKVVNSAADFNKVALVFQPDK
jgi:hypothetical protein